MKKIKSDKLNKAIDYLVKALYINERSLANFLGVTEDEDCGTISILNFILEEPESKKIEMSLDELMQEYQT